MVIRLGDLRIGRTPPLGRKSRMAGSAGVLLDPFELGIVSAVRPSPGAETSESKARPWTSLGPWATPRGAKVALTDIRG